MVWMDGSVGLQTVTLGEPHMANTTEGFSPEHLDRLHLLLDPHHRDLWRVANLDDGPQLLFNVITFRTLKQFDNNFIRIP